MANKTNKYVTPVGLQQPAAADLSDGTTGTGTVVLAGSPALTGSPTAPTQSPGDNSTKIATDAFVTAAVAAVTVPVTSVFGRTGAVVAAANDYTQSQIASGAIANGSTATTQAALDASTKVATDAYVDSAVGVEKARALAAEALLAPLASPALTGSPTAPTQTSGDNTTKIATDAFVQSAILAIPANSVISLRRRAVVITDGSTTTLQVQGDVITDVGLVNKTLVGINPAYGAGLQIVPQSGGSNTGWTGKQIIDSVKNPAMTFVGGCGRSTSPNTSRYWIGMTDQTGITMSNSDNPAGNYMAFRFSGGVDTTWKCITKDGTTQTIVDSGVTYVPWVNGTGPGIILTVVGVGSGSPGTQTAALFYINRTLVATINTHLPSSGNPIGLLVCAAAANASSTTNALMFLEELVWEQDSY